MPKEKQELWSQYISVNSNRGSVHPLVHDHYITGRRSIWLHAQMTGAVIKVDPLSKDARLLDEEEMDTLFNDY